MEEISVAERRLQLLEAAFADKLNKKTGWGRNEIMTAFREAMNDVHIQALSERVTK